MGGEAGWVCGWEFEDFCLGGGLLFGFRRSWGGGFADPARGITRGEGFFGGFLDGVEGGVVGVALHTGDRLSGRLLFCWFSHE